MVSGGWGKRGHRGRLSSSEVYSPEEDTFVPGHKLPMPVSSHCIANINDSHAILAGGYSDRSLIEARVYLLNKEEGTWTQLPSLVRKQKKMLGKTKVD